MAKAKTNVTGRFGLKSANINPVAPSGALASRDFKTKIRNEGNKNAETERFLTD